MNKSRPFETIDPHSLERTLFGELYLFIRHFGRLVVRTDVDDRGRFVERYSVNDFGFQRDYYIEYADAQYSMGVPVSITEEGGLYLQRGA